MNRSTMLLLCVSWLTTASASFVAGQAPAAAQRPTPPVETRAAAADLTKSANCTAPPLPEYKPPMRPIAGGRGSAQADCGKCDAIDGGVPPRVPPGVGPTLQSAHDAALRSIRSLTKSDPTWARRYLDLERTNAMGRTLEGRLYLRLDAIETILKSDQP